MLVLPTWSGLAVHSLGHMQEEQVTPNKEQSPVFSQALTWTFPSQGRQALHPWKLHLLTVLSGVFISPISRQSLPTHQWKISLLLRQWMSPIHSQWRWNVHRLFAAVVGEGDFKAKKLRPHFKRINPQKKQKSIGGERTWNPPSSRPGGEEQDPILSEV